MYEESSSACSEILRLLSTEENADRMDEKIRDYYKFQAAIIEPWDGPALVAFTDGDGVGPVGKTGLLALIFCHLPHVALGCPCVAWM